MQPFQVYTRVRPLNDREIVFGHNKTVVTHVDQSTVAVGSDDSRSTYFQVDAVFDENHSNQQIFERAVRPLADNFLRGINSTVFAYGITGAGKSFTMFGKQHQQTYSPGIIQLAFEYLCAACAQQEGVRLGLSYMQIYNEQVFDLLKNKSQNLQIQDDPVLGVVVCDLEEVLISDARSAQNYIQQGNHRRVIAETKANQFSSRSHAIVQITMEKVCQDSIYTAKLSLVDLAGSERQNVYTQSKGIRNFEGSNINRSLLTLGNCINILSEKRKSPFIPYRDSKLTRLLKQSLGGNTKTAMIACISPSVLTCDQTLNTMKYACRARKIEKTVHQNLKEPRTIQEMKRQMCKLRKQLELLRSSDDYKSNVRPKQQMQSLVYKLIKNVEALTLIKCNQAIELNDRIKQIDLMEEQRELVAALLTTQHRNTIDGQQYVSIQACKRAKTISIQHINVHSLTDDRGEIPISKKDIKKRKIIDDRQTDYENEQRVGKLCQPLKCVNYVRPNLQNIRLRYKQNRRTLKEIVCNYHQNYSVDELRLKESQRASQYLSNLGKHQQFLCGQDFSVLNKIRSGQQLQGQQLSRYRFEDIMGPFQEGQSVVADSPNNETQKDAAEATPRKQSNNRFLSSLEGIRRMMLKINATTQPITPEKLAQSNGGDFEAQFQFSTPLYDDY